MQTPHFAATRMGRACPGGLLCLSACQGGWPLAAPRFAHPIPESRRRNRVGLNQRFLRLFRVCALHTRSRNVQTGVPPAPGKSTITLRW
jgi:hypothetical protein